MLLECAGIVQEALSISTVGKHDACPPQFFPKADRGVGRYPGRSSRGMVETPCSTVQASLQQRAPLSALLTGRLRGCLLKARRGPLACATNGAKFPGGTWLNSPR